jgi:hypothetical protein
MLLAEIDWNSLFADPDLVVVFAVWAVVGGVVLGAIIAVQWRKVRQAEHEARLKERMVERGFTADEIIGVVNARASDKRVSESASRLDCCGAVPGC